jgi:hypothetical protein
MSTQWYYVTGGVTYGPVTSGHLQALAQAGTVVPDTLVWRQGLDGWQPAKKVRGLYAKGSPPSPPPPPAPQKQDTFAEMVQIPLRSPRNQWKLRGTAKAHKKLGLIVAGVFALLVLVAGVWLGSGLRKKGGGSSPSRMTVDEFGDAIAAHREEYAKQHPATAANQYDFVDYPTKTEFYAKFGTRIEWSRSAMTLTCTTDARTARPASSATRPSSNTTSGSTCTE